MYNCVMFYPESKSFKIDGYLSEVSNVKDLELVRLDERPPTIVIKF